MSLQTQQNTPFTQTIQKQFPIFKLQSYRIATLQGKILFFQGQVQPLQQSNMTLKQQLIALSKIVAFSTEILRELLLDNKDPTQQHKIAMANLYQLANYIAQDWKMMQHQLQYTKLKMTNAQIQTKKLQQQFKGHRKRLQTQITQLEIGIQDQQMHFLSKIQDLQQIIKEKQLSKQKTQRQTDAEIALLRKVNKQQAYQLGQLHASSTKKINQLQYKITCLQQAIKANLLEYEQSKHKMKKFLQKSSHDRLDEQAYTYQQIFKTKQEQKFQLNLKISLLQENICKQQGQIRGLQIKIAQDQKQLAKLKLDLFNQKGYVRSGCDKLEQMMDKIQEIKVVLKQKDMEIADKVQEMRQLGIKHIREIERIQKQHEKVIQLVRDEVKQRQNIIRDKQREIQQIKAQHSVGQAQFLIKIQELNLKFIQNQNNLNEQISTLQKSIQHQKHNLVLQKKSKQIDMQILRKQKQQVQRQFDRKYAVVKEQLFQQKEKSIILIKDQYQKYIQNEKYLKQRQLAQMGQKHRKEMQDILRQNMDQKLQNQTKFFLQKQCLQKQLSNSKQKVANMTSQLAAANRILKQHDNTIQQIKIKNHKIIKRMQQKQQMQIQMLQRTLQSQIDQFQSQIQKRQLKISQVKQQMQKQLQILRKQNGTDIVQARYQKQIAATAKQHKKHLSIKDQMLRAQLAQAQQSFSRKIQKIIQMHLQNEIKMKGIYQKILIDIIKMLEHEDKYIKERASHNVNTQIEECSQQQKIDYIGKLVAQKKQQILNLNNLIQQLTNNITQKQHVIQQMILNVQERVKERKEELSKQRQSFIAQWKQMIQKTVRQTSQSVKKTQQDCYNKVTVAERDRVDFSTRMLAQFRQMKQKNQAEHNLLLNKYNQLQKIFQQRPSRQEDINKIKELTSMHTKMNIQLKGYYKKVEKANQIVKYLNLQLQNYKEVYDIFTNAENNKINAQNAKSSQKSRLEVPVFVQKKQSNNKSSKASIHGNSVQMRKKQGQQTNKNGSFSTPKKKDIQSTIPKKKDLAHLKQIRLFTQTASIQQDYLQNRFIQQRSKSRKISYVNIQKNPQNLHLKTQKSKSRQKADRQPQLLLNATNFIKLLKNNTQQSQTPQLQKKRSYRRRRVFKKNTAVEQSF